VINSLLLIAGIIGFNVIAQLLLKSGVMRPGFGVNLPFSLINGYVVAGILCFVVSLGLYVSVLQRLPLILAQSLLSLQFVAIVLAAAVVLGERVAVVNWAGIAAIALGLFLLSR
jgi:drug/metabolite transporter (DMT)-like permease